uniref:glycogen/starch synthase n=1 Tax=Arcobacter sp. TaxID=1872629 RepID=UPI003D1028A6
KYIKNLNHDIRVMMPNYKSVNERKYVLRDVIRLQGLKIDIANETHNAKSKSAFIPNSKVQVYFLDNKKCINPVLVFMDATTIWL